MNSLLETTTKATLGYAAALVVASFAVWGVHTGVGAIAGAALAMGNWYLLRYTLDKLVRARVEQRAGTLFLLSIKLCVTGLAAFVVIRRLGADALGFMIGFGSLVLGILTASILFSAEAASESSGTDASAPAPTPHGISKDI